MIVPAASDTVSIAATSSPIEAPTAAGAGVGSLEVLGTAKGFFVILVFFAALPALESASKVALVGLERVTPAGATEPSELAAGVMPVGLAVPAVF